MVSRVNLIALTALMCLLTVANTGCMRCGQAAARKAVETAINQASGGKVNVDAGGSEDLSGLPDNLRYPGAKAVARWTMSGEKGASTVYSFETSDPGTSIIAFYKNALAGWKNVSTTETDKGTMMFYSSQDEKEIVSVATAPSDKGSGTAIIVTYTRNQ
jgi:hypothetical protein